VTGRKRCAECKKLLTHSVENFAVRGTAGARHRIYWDTRCRPCRERERAIALNPVAALAVRRAAE